MNLPAIILIALALAMDALAVSIAGGFIIKNLKIRHALRAAVMFGFFQGLMPFLGWSAGQELRSFLYHTEHWIAFGLLTIIGIKMIYEANSLEKTETRKDLRHFPTLLILAVATSIDALSAGLSFSFLKVDILLPIIIISLITFSLSLAGIYIGRSVEHFFEKKLEISGGVILILIGIKIVIQHYSTSGF